MSPATASFAEYLAPVAVGVPPTLISPAAFSCMDAVARLLPEVLAHNTFGFERRLGGGLPQADFLVRATTSHGRDSLTELTPGVGGHSAWERVRNFALCWRSPSSPLYRAVDNVWLEFDVTGPHPDTPSAFFGFRPAESAEAAGYEANVGGCLAATEEAVRLLTGVEPSPAARETLSGCFYALPSAAQVFQVGIMLSRATEAMRLCLRLRSLEDAMEYLAKVGWRGDENSLRATFEPVASTTKDLCLDVDVDEAVHPKVGLECYPGGPTQWALLLERLTASGMCTAEEWKALLAYPGYVAESTTDAPWPETLRRASRLLASRSTSIFVRSLHHVKVVHRPAGEPEAKAYLAVDHHWHIPKRSPAACGPVSG